MDQNRIEETRSNTGLYRKPYRTPNKLMVLGGIDTVVQGSTHLGNDGGGSPSTANS
jgi:hypothetical protein